MNKSLFVVTECLDLHEKCTGAYVDTSGIYLVKCTCPCHLDKKSKTNDRPVTVTGANCGVLTS